MRHLREWVRRWRGDLRWRGRLTLYGTLTVNLTYAVYKAAAALYYRSLWFGTMAGYYILLSTVRLALVRQLHARQIDRRQEYRRYRFCGWLLLAMTPAVVTMGEFLLHGSRAPVYPGHSALPAAGYTAYTVLSAAVNLVRYRRLQSPVFSAGRAISLATALVSLYSLSIALSAAARGRPGSIQSMAGQFTGMAVLVLIVSMAVFMICHANRALRRL